LSIRFWSYCFLLDFISCLFYWPDLFLLNFFFPTSLHHLLKIHCRNRPVIKALLIFLGSQSLFHIKKIKKYYNKILSVKFLLILISEVNFILYLIKRALLLSSKFVRFSDVCFFKALLVNKILSGRIP